MKTQVTLVVAAALVLAVACQKSESSPAPADGSDAPITPQEAQAIAEEAYVYAYPMMESYRTMYVQAIDRTAPGYLAPFNEITHMTRLLGPDFEDVVRPNNDTLYSTAWLDLRAQPMVITVPNISDRYFSVQLIDMFTHNFAYMGTRATKGEAGSYVVAGPAWQGAKPGDTKAVFKSESEFVYCIVRIEVRGPGDVADVNALQKAFHLTHGAFCSDWHSSRRSFGIAQPRSDYARGRRRRCGPSARRNRASGERPELASRCHRSGQGWLARDQGYFR